MRRVMTTAIAAKAATRAMPATRTISLMGPRPPGRRPMSIGRPRRGTPGRPAQSSLARRLARSSALSIGGAAGDHLRDVDAEGARDLAEQRGDRRRVRAGVRRQRLAVAAIDQVDLADLEAAGRLRDLREDAVEVLEHEHVHRLAAALAPRRGDLG